jgi:glycosyltransferase involved in cell wall biosynthesis
MECVMNASPSSQAPRVSVLMPIFNQVAFVGRALGSLLVQSLPDWELLIIDDGSTDELAAALAPFIADPRLRLLRLEHNSGLGAALNTGLAAAQGDYIAYLPADDHYYPAHLHSLVACLDAQPDAVLAYAGVRYHYNRYAQEQVPNEPLQLVQVLHRRTTQRWLERSQLVSDDLERLFWQRLRADGLFVATRAISCEWVDHPLQHHKLIAGRDGGLSRYRRHYGIGGDLLLNWQPSQGMPLNERARFERYRVARALPNEGGLRILLLGELGFNPERIVAFEERGHKLYGSWIARPETWDTTGPLPFGNVEELPLDRRWPERVREAHIDLIYALLNWQAVALIDEAVAQLPDMPLVFHFKEGPFICQELGLWPALMRIMRRAQGVVLINQESRAWFELAAPGLLRPERTLLLDGDPPKIDYMTDDWPARLSDADGEIHTVCAGRPLGLDPFEAIADANIHVHFYGQFFQQRFPNWTKNGLATGYMHLHPAVEPADWVRELGRYDAAWFHVFESDNGGDMRRAHWDDLNLPARLGTYASAGLPWILKHNPGSRSALGRLGNELGVGVFFDDFAHLAAQLRDRQAMQHRTHNMRAARSAFAFDPHVDGLLALFRQASAGGC